MALMVIYRAIEKAGYKECIEADELSNWNTDDFEVVLE